MTEINLYQYRQTRSSFLSAKPIETLRQINCIERMNDVKQINYASRFVGLKVSDEVPAHLLVADFSDLRLRLLDAVLAEIRDPVLNRLLNIRRWVGLADGYQPDLIGFTAALYRGAGQPRANVRKSYCQ